MGQEAGFALKIDLGPAEEKVMQNAPAHINYQAIEEQRFNELQKSITQRLGDSKDLGHGDSLRHVVLMHIVQGNYDLAKEQLDQFVREKGDFPNFQVHVERIRRYCVDLINAIETKRNFHGVGSLPLAKQQELYEKVLVHFDELKGHLKIIERQEKEAKLEDIRSTVWVLKALTNCVFFVVGFAFFLDLTGGLGESFQIVFDSFVTTIADVFFKAVGW